MITTTKTLHRIRVLWVGDSYDLILIENRDDVRSIVFHDSKCRKKFTELGVYELIVSELHGNWDVSNNRVKAKEIIDIKQVPWHDYHNFNVKANPKLIFRDHIKSLKHLLWPSR